MSTPNKYFLFDTNLLRRLTRNGHEAELDTFWGELDSRGISKGGSVLQPIVSSFILIEVVGIRLSGEPPSPSAEVISQFKLPADHAVWVYEQARSFYENLPELKLENFKLCREESRKYLSNEGKGLFDAVIANNLERSNFEKDVCNSLALDRMLQYQYPEDIVSALHMGGFWPMVRKALEDGSDLSFLRLGVRMWERLPARKRRDLFKVDNQKDLAKIFSVKSIGDLVDTELVHLTVVGKSIEGKRVPVEALTFDDPQVIKNRIGIYKGILRLIKEKFEESGLDADQFSQFESGVAHVFSTDGKLRESIPVNSVVID